MVPTIYYILITFILIKIKLKFSYLVTQVTCQVLNSHVALVAPARGSIDRENLP